MLDLVRSTVTWNGLVEQFPDSATAQIYYDQVVAAMTSVNGTTPSAFIQNLTATPVITDFSPRTFSVANDGTFIQVIGYGFTSVLNGKYLFFEDNIAGSTFNDGYRMVLTFVNSNLMTGIWSGDGDTVLPAGPSIIYVTLVNTGPVSTPPNVSNILPATGLGNAVISIE